MLVAKTFVSFFIGVAFAAVATVDKCVQSSSEENCAPYTAGGAIPAGATFLAAMSDSCQGTGECDDCCMELEASMTDGTGAAADYVELVWLTGSKKDDQEPYLVENDITSPCKGTYNTSACAKAVASWVTSPTTTVEVTKVFKLTCQACGVVNPD